MASISLPTTPTLKSLVQSRVVVVTGAASGIGFATARLFAEHGAKVVLVDLHRNRLQAAAAEIGHASTFYTCDVASWADQVRLYQWLSQSVGAPDIVCLNAGVDPELATVNASESVSRPARGKVITNYLASECDGSSHTAEGDIRGVGSLKKPTDVIFDVNLKGVVYGLKLAIDNMASNSSRRAGGESDKFGGRVIITGSAASYTPVPNQDLYGASKHAVLGLMRSTSRRKELQTSNISVAMVAPWLTTTAMTAEIATDVKADAHASTPEDVAWAAAYFATAERDEVNGRCVWVNGKTYLEVERSYEAWLAQLMSS